MKDFVNYNLALKLKEKGFKEKCLAYYDVEDNVGLLYNTQYSDDLCPCQYTDLLISYNSGYIVSNLDDSGNCIDAPTISQVLKWLREEKKIYIMVDRSFSVRGWHYYIIDDDDFENPIQQEVEHNRCYEQAAIDAIEYILDNLI